MSQSSEKVWKEGAVRIHDEQAELFRQRYDVLATDPYWDTFTYSRLKISAVLDQYLDQEPKGSTLLDAGCGTGHQLRQYTERGFKCTGCDPSAEMLARARELNPDLRIEQGDIEKLPFEDGTFDVVIAIEVMRYLNDIRPSLREVLRVLKPGGLSLITYAPLLSTTLFPILNWLTVHARLPGFSNVRQSFQTVGGLNRAYKGAGFDHVNIHGRFLGPFIYASRLARPLGSRMLRAWEPIDDRISDTPLLRNFTNLIVVAARKPHDAGGSAR